GGGGVGGSSAGGRGVGGSSAGGRGVGGRSAGGGGVGGRGVGGCVGSLGGGGGAGLGEQFFQAGAPDAAEGPVVADAVQDGHFELGGRELGALAVVRGGQRGQCGSERLGQVLV